MGLLGAFEGGGIFLTLLPTLETLLLLLGCLAQLGYVAFCLVLLYLVWLLCFGDPLLLYGKWKGADLGVSGGRKLQGVVGGKTVVKMYCMRDHFVFNNKKLGPTIKLRLALDLE